MRKCELLVPAGGSKQFIAAVENGADAVYVGGKSFNARVNAQNFSDEEIEKAIDYAHLRNVKTYITMNTLLDDEELAEAYQQACRYYSMGVDALIIQDLGLGKLLKERLPDLPLHLSTQGGVYDSKGVLAAAKLGYERVVMARELTFDEIREAVSTGVEIEVFVHGALCICYSGQCQLSRFIGGRSGNKGACAQPCRLPYSGIKGEKYPLSPKDLCLVEEIGKLAEAGVASLKIEGRMKSPEYVAVVTSVYRKYLDEWQRKGSYKVSKEDWEALKQVFNRGGFTKGYFYGNPGADLMSPDFSKNAGVFVGTVNSNSTGPLVEINTEKEIVKGDYIEIRSRELTGNLVTYAEPIGKNRMRVGDIKSEVKKGDKVYRLTSSKMMKEAKKTFDNITFEEGKFIRKAPIKAEVKIIAGKEFSLTVRAAGVEARVKSNIIPEVSESGRSCGETVKLQIAKTGGTAFYVDNIAIEEPVPAHIQLSAVNALRRQALPELEGKIKEKYKRMADRKPLPERTKNRTELARDERGIEIYFDSKESFFDNRSKDIVEKCRSIAGDKIRALVPISQYEECMTKAEELNIGLMPYVAGMSKGKNEFWLEKNLDRIARVLRDDGTGVYAGNIGQIELLADAGLKVYGDYGLNISNSEAYRAYGELGMQEGIKSLEWAEATAGSIPLMITEHKFNNTVITDRKGAQYSIKFDESTDKSVLKAHKSAIDWNKIKSDYKVKSIRIYV